MKLLYFPLDLGGGGEAAGAAESAKVTGSVGLVSEAVAAAIASDELAAVAGISAAPSALSLLGTGA
jgi:hypothetical protein